MLCSSWPLAFGRGICGSEAVQESSRRGVRSFVPTAESILRRIMAQEVAAASNGAAAPAAELATLKLSTEASAATNGHAQQHDDDHDDEDGEDDAAEPAANGATGASSRHAVRTRVAKLTRVDRHPSSCRQEKEQVDYAPPALGSWSVQLTLCTELAQQRRRRATRRRRREEQQPSSRRNRRQFPSRNSSRTASSPSERRTST